MCARVSGLPEGSTFTACQPANECCHGVRAWAVTGDPFNLVSEHLVELWVTEQSAPGLRHHGPYLLFTLLPLELRFCLPEGGSAHARIPIEEAVER